MQEVLLESETPGVRAVAAAGLGNSGNVASVPQLLDAMEDDALVTRQAAARSIARLLGWREGFNPQDPPEARAETRTGGGVKARAFAASPFQPGAALQGAMY